MGEFTCFSLLPIHYLSSLVTGFEDNEHWFEMGLPSFSFYRYPDRWLYRELRIEPVGGKRGCRGTILRLLGVCFDALRGVLIVAADLLSFYRLPLRVSKSELGKSQLVS